MIVLLDLEWIEKNEKHLTQLSAVRTDEKWNVVGSLDEIARPTTACLRERDHMAFGGYDTLLFANAFPEEECISDLAEWIQPEDVIMVWAKSNKRYLTELWAKHLDTEIPRIVSAADKARNISMRNALPANDPYVMLSRYGDIPPQPQHRASNDTEVMRRLFSNLGLTLAHFEEGKTSQKIPERDRIQQVIEKSQYNYIYLKNSDVFHRRTCKACLSARSHTEIIGSVHYETAAKERRPCKLCHPEPIEVHPPIKPCELLTARRSTVSNEIISAKMLTGEVIPIKRKNILGWCHNKIHEGAVNRSLLEKHDCLGKNCPFLERNEQSSFWKNYQAEQEEKAQRKEERRKEKRQKAIENEELQYLTDSWRTCLKGLDTGMHIVRVAKDSPKQFSVFYVSDNRFADGHCFPSFLAAVRLIHPHYKLSLRHIRDVDGHFVTREEYFARPRK